MSSCGLRNLWGCVCKTESLILSLRGCAMCYADSAMQAKTFRFLNKMQPFLIFFPTGKKQAIMFLTASVYISTKSLKGQ